MNTNEAFAKALRTIRNNKDLTQEDFSIVSSRTYLSELERAIKSPTVEKLDDITSVLGIHPITLLAITYMNRGDYLSTKELCNLIEKEIKAVVQHEE